MDRYRPNSQSRLPPSSSPFDPFASSSQHFGMQQNPPMPQYRNNPLDYSYGQKPNMHGGAFHGGGFNGGAFNGGSMGGANQGPQQAGSHAYPYNNDLYGTYRQNPTQQSGYQGRPPASMNNGSSYMNGNSYGFQPSQTPSKQRTRKQKPQTKSQMQMQMKQQSQMTPQMQMKPSPLTDFGSPVSSSSFGMGSSAYATPPVGGSKPPHPSMYGDSSYQFPGAKPTAPPRSRVAPPQSEKKTRRRRRDVDWRVRNDEQAYMKVLRNRQAAARSNEKRRRVRQQFDNEMGGLLEQKVDLAEKERRLKEENRRLKQRMSTLKKK